MLKSMTAFARTELSDAAGDIVWEVKSVNHRYLELGFKLPEEFRALEPDIRAVVARFLKRGKLDISLRYRLNRTAPANIRLNAELVKNLRSVEQEVLKIVHEGHSLAVADILRWPGVVEESEQDFKPLQELAMSGLDEVLQQLVINREREGQAIHEMIAPRCATISEIVAKVKVRRPEVVEAIRSKWTQQLKDKMAQWSESADAGRLEQELTLLVQKIDVDEELDRLTAHVREVEQVLQRDEPVGRRLDFLMQELNREANTLSSKSQDLETTAYAVDLKVLIEQMREQVQNVE